MAVIQRQGSLVPKIDPKDFVVDFAGAAQTALNISESMKNNRLNRAKVEASIINDKKQAQLAESRIKIANKELEFLPKKLELEEKSANAQLKFNDAQVRNMNTLADRNEYESRRTENDNLWLANNNSRMVKALFNNDWDEIEQIQSEVVARGKVVNDKWNTMFGPWSQQEWTIGDETRPKSQWLSIKNQGDAKNGALGTIMTAEDKVIRGAELRRIAMREDLKAKHGLNDAQVDKFMQNQSERFMLALNNNVRKTNLAKKVAALGTQLEERLVDRIKREKGIFADEDITKFVNIGDRDLNAATVEYADEAIRLFNSGKIGQNLTPAGRGQAIANLKTLKSAAKALGVRRFGKVWDAAKAKLGVTIGLKTIDKDFEDFEAAYRNADKLEGQAKINELNKITKEYFEWLNELMGSGGMDNLEEQGRILQVESQILEQGPFSIPGAIEATRSPATIVEESIEAQRTQDNPASI